MNNKDKLLKDIWDLIDKYNYNLEFAIGIDKEGTITSWGKKRIEEKLDITKSFNEQTSTLQAKIIDKIKKGE